MVQQSKRSRLLLVSKNKFKNKIFLGTQKCPRYESETAPEVIMKYLVDNDKERQAKQPVDPIEAFFKIIAATVKTFSPHHQNICQSRISAIVSEVEMTEILQETKSTHSSQCSSGSPDETGTQRN